MLGEARERATARHRKVQYGAQIHSACTCVRRRWTRSSSIFVRLDARLFSCLSPKVGAIDPAQSQRRQRCASSCTTCAFSTSRKRMPRGTDTQWFAYSVVRCTAATCRIEDPGVSDSEVLSRFACVVFQFFNSANVSQYTNSRKASLVDRDLLLSMLYGVRFYAGITSSS